MACRVGAGAIGLNLWPGSKRFVAMARARAITEAMTPGVLKVGVFVNPDPLALDTAMTELGLDLVQLHGDEDSRCWRDLPGSRVIRAIRVADAASLDRTLGWSPRYFLYDSFVPGYGGAGHPAPWRTIASGARRPSLLAGGLHARNVEEAIGEVQPDGVDVASGVEAKPGEKDPGELAAFVTNALRAAARLAPRPQQ